MPRIDIPAKPLIDELGQWLPGEWPGKVPGRAACTARLNTMADSADPDEKRGEIANGPDLHESTHEVNDDDVRHVVRHAVDHPYAAFPAWDRFGGWMGRRFEATGWFRVEREMNPDGTMGRFWLVDPEGGAFLSTGVDCIGAGIQTRLDPMRPWLDAHTAGLLDQAIEKAAAGSGSGREGTNAATDFGDPSFSWRPDLRGCNGVSASYDYGQANLRAAFGDDWYDAWTRITRNHLTDWGVNTIGNWSDRRFIRRAGIPYVLPADELNGGFPKTEPMLFRDFPDVFSPEYARDAERYAQGLLPWKDETNLIGYFMRNEPNWAFVYDLNIAEEMLANPADLASKRRFVEWLKERYNGDVDALNTAWEASFASFDAIIDEPRFRLATKLPGSADDLRAFSTLLIDRYVRVPAEALRHVDPHHLNLGMRYAYITDRSLLAGADCYDVFSINSYQRTAYDQVEQVGRMLDMPVMVGEFHHGALGRFDGENYQIGLVDVCMQEYPEMAEAMHACHRSLYEVAAGEHGAFDRIPEEINPIHY